MGIRAERLSETPVGIPSRTPPKHAPSTAHPGRWTCIGPLVAGAPL